MENFQLRWSRRCPLVNTPHLNSQLKCTQSQSQSQSQSYITTDGQTASVSSSNAPIWGLRQDIYYFQTVVGLLMWGALSDERTGLSFARITVSSSKSVVSMYNLHFTYF
jgi:hypothetical protein